MINVPVQFLHLFDTLDADLSDDAPDVLDKFFRAGPLRGALGRDAADKLSAELADIESQFAKLHAAPTPAPAPKKIERAADDDDLAKRYTTAAGRRRQNYENYLRAEMATGHTVDELVSYAKRTDSEVANLLAEIGAEIERGIA
jgi:hypothetical protein